MEPNFGRMNEARFFDNRYKIYPYLKSPSAVSIIPKQWMISMHPYVVSGTPRTRCNLGFRPDIQCHEKKEPTSTSSDTKEIEIPDSTNDCPDNKLDCVDKKIV
ncbi:hypothetical protein PV325_009288 [Microctonus aethiopoides]|uniref:Uncharacterized protein n=1 Tax=Microctonus aethiopoides TaxID=144406 RepID=A0AA39FVE2_9HYME|nr:hypothetical protein PV325_009288 [Microctonus aethiopoides]KAK0175984.1 hypothetical protein PV328_000166 [Microctonus aethiopoides]